MSNRSDESARHEAHIHQAFRRTIDASSALSRAVLEPGAAGRDLEASARALEGALTAVRQAQQLSTWRADTLTKILARQRN